MNHALLEGICSAHLSPRCNVFGDECPTKTHSVRLSSFSFRCEPWLGPMPGSPSAGRSSGRLSVNLSIQVRWLIYCGSGSEAQEVLCLCFRSAQRLHAISVRLLPTALQSVHRQLVSSNSAETWRSPLRVACSSVCLVYGFV